MTATVTLALNNPGSVNGANLNGSLTFTVSGGVTTWSALKINKAGNFSITATAGSLTVTSNSITVT